MRGVVDERIHQDIGVRMVLWGSADRFGTLSPIQTWLASLFAMNYGDEQYP